MKGNHKCDECLYEYLSECEHPCNVCRWKVKERGLAFFGKLSYFEPKEEKMIMKSTWSIILNITTEMEQWSVLTK